MAGCIEDLLAYWLGDVDWHKDFNRSPFKDGFQDLVHITSMLLLQHTNVVIATCDDSEAFAILPGSRGKPQVRKRIAGFVVNLEVAGRAGSQSGFAASDATVTPPTAVGERKIREDLLARINLWTFSIPSLKNRPEDIEPNLELDGFAEKAGSPCELQQRISGTILGGCSLAGSLVVGQFSRSDAAVARMATLALGARICKQVVDEKTSRLSAAWHQPDSSVRGDLLEQFLTHERLKEIDAFDRAQLAFVIGVCERSRSLSEAGHTLFGASRLREFLSNDADRQRKCLARFGLEVSRIHTTARFPAVATP